MDLKSTLNLPEPDSTIPMKANLPILETSIQAIWDQEGIYHQIQKARAGAPSYVLHDGPPYTNSQVHLGTAMNKILKDFVVKSRTMMGYRAPFVPGFDTHGLPIEQAVMKKFQEKKITPTIPELLRACRAHAREFIDVQTRQFKRLGVFGLWEDPYYTMDYRFEAGIVRVFKRLVEGGHVYKGLRPTLWSTTSRTALADTEIVYHDHVSKAIYVRFPFRRDPNQIFSKFPNLYTIIWTTTPWTIPANLAVAFHPSFSYSVISVGSDHYLLLSDLVEKVAGELGWADYKEVKRFDGINLEHVEFSHPIFDRPSVAVMAEYVTTGDGTGVVHTAPSHGRDDFYTGQKYGLAVPNTVDERGMLTAETGEFAGTYYKDCDTVVVDRLRELGALLKVSDYSHSYPYAERDGQPVIFRATEQWFVAVDPIRAQLLKEITKVEWFPPTGLNRIDAMVRNRPDWCISRQRPWGVGVPVFYGLPSRTPVLDPVAIEAVAKLVEQEGCAVWFEKDAKEILPAGYVHPQTGETEFAKETDVLDVWFDSGSTSLNVFEGDVRPAWKEHWPADLYLEGSDQHRGWFNTSLIIGTAIRGSAPYKAVLTHGFVADEKGQKMSKRLGNIIEPEAACNTYGADVLRYWVAGVDYTNDVPCSDAILRQFGENYRNVRNTLRFLLGNLGGFSPDVAVTELMPLDEWIVEQADLLVSDCIDAYARFEFGQVVNSVHSFCREELSKFYLDVVKDRMYCEASDSFERRSGQTACYHVLTELVKLIAPILIHTAEETWTKLHEVLGLTKPSTVHAEEFGQNLGTRDGKPLCGPSSERLQEIEASPLQVRFSTFRAIRDDVLAAFERFKGVDDIKNSQQVLLKISEQGERLEVLRSFDEGEVATMLMVSWVDLSEGEPSIEFVKSEYLECKRSRLRRPDVQVVELDGEEVPLTARDRRVLGVA